MLRQTAGSFKFKIQNSKFRIQGSGFKIQNLGFKIQDLRLLRTNAFNPKS